MTGANRIRPPRIKVFVDYWNFQLLVNRFQRQDKISLDWQNLGEWLSKKASEQAKIPSYDYEGTNIYTSYNPKKEKGFFGSKHDRVQLPPEGTFDEPD